MQNPVTRLNSQLHQYVTGLDLKMQDTHLLLETRGRNQIDYGKPNKDEESHHPWNLSPMPHVLPILLNLYDNVVRQL